MAQTTKYAANEAGQQRQSSTTSSQISQVTSGRTASSKSTLAVEDHARPLEPAKTPGMDASESEMLIYMKRLKEENEKKELALKQLNYQMAKMALVPQLEALERRLQAAQDMFDGLRNQVAHETKSSKINEIDGNYDQQPIDQSDAELGIYEDTSNQRGLTASTRAGEQLDYRTTSYQHTARHRSSQSAAQVEQNLSNAHRTVENLKEQLEEALTKIIFSPSPGPDGRPISGRSLAMAEEELQQLTLRIRETRRNVKRVKSEIYDLMGLDQDPDEPSSDEDDKPETPPLPPPVVPKKDFQEKFIAAAKRGDADAVQFHLTNSDVRIDERGHDGCTALNVAAEKGHLDVVRILVGMFGADLEVRDIIYSWTPLMFAAFMGHLHVVQYLLQYGAKVNTRNPKGNTALSLAHEGPVLLVSGDQKKKTIELLERRGAKY